ncbi:Uncharacterized conserved protein (some members contain a von Willebrand factor type A (vWA) domain) [Anaerotruncus sp. 2789STDY5834896]|uniref:Uncharacterized conserved protein (Some members contain a von Willebrand factor type A (VWA) domain) n=1 Tax=uncultured Anaerotruncus sp. TaxID=905011 RepID=A0A1C6JK01_9FIRM|nr:Uncharacterized conserved protein (some members contain a von Willebrand factor type A (vWA) domain) [uncultured Anaerotruncus sp.]
MRGQKPGSGLGARLFYALLLVAALGFFALYRWYFSFWCLLVLLALPPVLLLGQFLSARQLQLRLPAERQLLTVGGTYALPVVVSCGLLAPAQCFLQLAYESVHTGHRQVFWARLPVRRGRQQIELPLDADHAGHYRVWLRRCRVRDVFGLTGWRVAVQGSCDLLVLPPDDLEPLPPDLDMRGENGTVDGEREGDELLNPLYIREYRPGEDLRTVHWKLTAARQQLLVRQPGDQIQRQTLLCPLLPAKALTFAQQDWLCATTYRLARALALESCPAALAFADASGSWHYRELELGAVDVAIADWLQLMVQPESLPTALSQLPTAQTGALLLPSLLPAEEVRAGLPLRLRRWSTLYRPDAQYAQVLPQPVGEPPAPVRPPQR